MSDYERYGEVVDGKLTYTDPPEGATYAHDASCNATHTPGPEACPPAVDDPMPVFQIKGRDALAPAAVAGYLAECTLRGLHAQAREVQFAYSEIVEWQHRNPGLVKLPDHQHVPATEGGS